MATLSFKYKDGSIYIRYNTAADTRCLITTGIKVPKEFFNPKSITTPIRMEFPGDHAGKNVILRKLYNEADALFNKMLFDNGGNPPSATAFKAAWDAKYKPEKHQQPKQPFTTLWHEYAYYKQFDCGEDNISPATVRQYDSYFARYLDYNDTVEPIDVHNLPNDFYAKFFAFCGTKRNNKSGTGGNSVATVNNYITNFKGFLSWCEVEKGIAVNKKAMAKMKNKAQKHNFIDLDVSDVNAIRALNLTDPVLSATRDYMVVLCLLGVRTGDLERLLPSHLINRNGSLTLDMKNQKTGSLIHVTVLPIVKAILDKYPTQTVREWMPAEWLLRPKIKEVCQLARLNEEFTFERKFVGGKQAFTKFKYELITPHSGRRFFVSLLDEAGASVADISEITGQTKETVLRYIQSRRKKVGEHMAAFGKIIADNAKAANHSFEPGGSDGSEK